MNEGETSLTRRLNISAIMKKFLLTFGLVMMFSW